MRGLPFCVPLPLFTSTLGFTSKQLTSGGGCCCCCCYARYSHKRKTFKRGLENTIVQKVERTLLCCAAVLLKAKAVCIHPVVTNPPHTRASSCILRTVVHSLYTFSDKSPSPALHHLARLDPVNCCGEKARRHGFFCLSKATARKVHKKGASPPPPSIRRLVPT